MKTSEFINILKDKATFCESFRFIYLDQILLEFDNVEIYEGNRRQNYSNAVDLRASLPSIESWDGADGSYAYEYSKLQYSFNHACMIDLNARPAFGNLNRIIGEGSVFENNGIIVGYHAGSRSVNRDGSDYENYNHVAHIILPVSLSIADDMRRAGIIVKSF